MSRESKQITTYNLMILDRSGSMSSVKDVTIRGLNEQLQSIAISAKDYPDQKQSVCLVTFSNDVNTDIWMKNIEDIAEFNDSNYSPCGGTALLDAVGTSMAKLKSEIKEELADRTANIIVTIFTDGEENASREYENDAIKNLVNEAKDSGQWTVAFVGCGNNVFEVAASMGITRGNTLCYKAGEKGTASAFTSLSHARTIRSANYATCMAEGTETNNINAKVDFFVAPTEIKNE